MKSNQTYQTILLIVSVQVRVKIIYSCIQSFQSRIELPARFIFPTRTTQLRGRIKITKKSPDL